jgi:uncharacterized membrane protein YvbJ
MALTKEEKKHTADVLKVLTRASKELLVLNRRAQRSGVFPNTTQKAYVEVEQVKHNTELRVTTRNAQVV